MLIPNRSDAAVEECKILMIGIEEAMEDPGILLSEGGCMKLVIGYGLSLLFRIWSCPLTIECIGMCEYDVQPYGGFNLFHNVCEIDSGNALYGFLISGEWLKE